MNGAAVLEETLERAGVTHAFGVVGTTVLSILDEMDRNGIRYVSTRHEQVSAGMAAGYALATREPTISISHVGPGAANQVIGVTAAHRDNVPVLSITGNEPSYLLGNDCNHEWDVTGVFSEFTKRSVQVTEEQLAKQVRNAVTCATTGMPGPVHLDVPSNVSDAEVARADDRTIARFVERDFHASTTRARPPTDTVERTRTLLAAAERPLIVAGSEFRWFDGKVALARLAETLDVPVVTTESARGALSETHPCSLGVVVNPSVDAANDYFADADLVVGIGTRFSDLTTRNWQLIDRDASIVQASIRADELDRHYVADVSVLADPASFCAELTDALAESNLSFADVTEAAREAYESERTGLLDTTTDVPDVGVDPRRVVNAVRRLAGKYTITTGGGIHNTFPRLLPVSDLDGYIGTRNFTGMSQGLPLALGAQLGLDRQVITFEGDGGFSMVMQDLETAVREDIPVKVIIFNNDAYLSHARRQQRNYGGRLVGTRLTNPAYDRIAEEFGMFGEAVAENEAVEDAVGRLLSTSGPGLLDVQVDPER